MNVDEFIDSIVFCKMGIRSKYYPVRSRSYGIMESVRLFNKVKSFTEFIQLDSADNSSVNNIFGHVTIYITDRMMGLLNDIEYE